MIGQSAYNQLFCVFIKKENGLGRGGVGWGGANGATLKIAKVHLAVGPSRIGRLLTGFIY